MLMASEQRIDGRARIAAVITHPLGYDSGMLER